MMKLQASHLQKAYGADLILSNITMEVQSYDRIGLVGRNGAGKSTLLKIIAGIKAYDSGTLTIPANVTVGYLSQHTALDSTQSIWEEMMTVFAPLVQMEQQLRTLEEKMADPDQLDEKLFQDYDQLQLRYKNEGGYTYETDIRAVLNGLHFGQIDETTPISALSGGQKTRLALGKKLLEKPDVLLLDEPTNHLDIETLTWLEGYLQNYPGALVIVSHDRYFLDHTISQIYEISRQQMQHYYGNYSYYLDKKAAQFAQDMKAYEKQQKEVAQLEDFIQRNIARASTSKRAQSRRKRLEKMTQVERPQGDEKSVHFSFNVKRSSGREVLHVDHLNVGYDDEAPIFQNLNFVVSRGESIALIGSNGIGKTTLLKTIAGMMPPLHGDITYGSHVTIGYYDQEQLTLTSQKTVLDELWDDYPLTQEKDIRTTLGNFLFSGDDVQKTVNDLSGGEKARLALAKLKMQEANFLLLDEPTNHLDLDSKEVVENALADYPGTILYVSHDRYFINSNATKVMELSPDGLTAYLGNYDDYMAKKAEMAERERLAQQDQGRDSKKEEEPSEGKQAFQERKKAKQEENRRQRRIEEIEREIEAWEQNIEDKQQQLTTPEVYENHEEASRINQAIAHGQKQLETLMEEWEALQT